MAVDPSVVVGLYRKDKLPMQKIADRLGITKSRVHQILQAEGVDTSHGAVARPAPERPPRPEKAYRAYQMTEQTRGLVDRLAAALNDTKTAVVNRAVEELADKLLPGWRGEKQGGGDAAEGGPKRKRGKARREGG